MAPEVDPAQASVVLASFENRRGAEHMLASLGRGFRRKARHGGASAFVVSLNKDGSLKVTQSRVLEAGGLVSALIRVSLAWTVGFMGLWSSLRGAEGVRDAAHQRQGRVGSDDQSAHAILARAGPHAAIALVCCDAETQRAVAAHAADRGSESWEGSRTEFLAALDPGAKHDWVRAALGEPTSTNR
jgi:hypothetical protein